MKLPHGLKAVADRIESRDGGHLAPATLAHALRGALDIDDVAPFVKFDSANYVRNLVTKNDRWELRLLCWRPGQSTTVHGHGTSACAFRIIRGSATETVLGERDRTWAPGAVVEESSSMLIHQVSNRQSDALVTLHAYSPPLPVDAPSKREGRSVVIIGGGFSGAALAYHLLLRGGPDLRITVVERGPWLGRGIAYGIDSSTFRLNVPASRMSIDPDVPDDFVAWARAKERPNAFLERAQYGQYVVSRIGRAIGGAKAKLRIFRGEAASVEQDGVRTTTGELLPADVVVVATGLTARVTASGLPDDARIIDAWDECGLTALPTDGRVLVLGAGLSALDVVALMNVRGFRGRLTILSRNGLLPRPHLDPLAFARPLPAEIANDAPKDLRGLIRWVRAVVEDGERRGEPWQLGIDSLRAHLPGLWSSLSADDRRRFIDKVRPFWEVVRHRAPTDSLRTIDRLRAEDRLELLAGKIAACEPDDDGLGVTIRLRGGGTRRERYAAIVRCVGPALRSSESNTPVLKSLFDAGVASSDAAGLGFATDAHGALIGKDGRSADRYFALGAHRRASMWESTSVPDIAVHARALAARIVT